MKLRKSLTRLPHFHIILQRTLLFIWIHEIMCEVWGSFEGQQTGHAGQAL